jgi:hypothetical protein
MADAYATAALRMGSGAPDWLRRLDGHEAFVVDAGGGPGPPRASLSIKSTKPGQASVEA